MAIECLRMPLLSFVDGESGTHATHRPEQMLEVHGQAVVEWTNRRSIALAQLDQR